MLIVGGFLFWLYLAIIGCFLLACVINDAPVVGTLVVIGALLLVGRLFDADLTPYMPRTWQGWALLAAGYIPIGVAWSMFKFYVTYKKSIRELAGEKARFTPGVVDKTWNDFVDRRAPKASGMKSDITSWITCWPLSVAIYLLADLLSDFVNAIYSWFSGIYERIAANIRNSIKD